MNQTNNDQKAGSHEDSLELGIAWLVPSPHALPCSHLMMSCHSCTRAATASPLKASRRKEQEPLTRHRLLDQRPSTPCEVLFWLRGPSYDYDTQVYDRIAYLLQIPHLLPT